MTDLDENRRLTEIETGALMISPVFFWLLVVHDVD